MLGNRGQPLIQEEFQADMIRANDECATPKVWTPVAHRLDQSH
jgi:hypothetical protein